MKENRPILFYDGECKLCHRTVQFIIDNEASPDFKFAHLQDPHVKSYLEQFEDGPLSDSIYVLTNQKLYKYSNAAITISSYLNSPYKYLKYSKIFPRIIRDAVYKLVAANRFRFAGRYELCLFPSALEGRIFVPPKDIPKEQV